MEKDKRRALRRHHRERRIRAEYKKWARTWYMDPGHALRQAQGQLRTICSCDMCGNPRHNGWTKLEESHTMQERKAPTVQDDWGVAKDYVDYWLEFLLSDDEHYYCRVA